MYGGKQTVLKSSLKDQDVIDDLASGEVALPHSNES